MTRKIFLALVLLLGVQRILELRLSRSNEMSIRKRGGQEHAAPQFRWMQALHATWFLSMLGEVFLLRRQFRPALAALAVMGVAVGQCLRYAAIRTLGSRWTVRVMTLPNSPLVQEGIYRRFRHPNYLGVALEIAAFPLLHGAVFTSLVYSLLNGCLLRDRIRVEERALCEALEGA